MPIPPSQGCIVFHTPNEPSRIFCPMPNSIKNNGIPSRINITKNGIKKAPAKWRESTISSLFSWCKKSFFDVQWVGFSHVQNFISLTTGYKNYYDIIIIKRHDVFFTLELQLYAPSRLDGMSNMRGFNANVRNVFIWYFKAKNAHETKFKIVQFIYVAHHSI